jgi:hypothetical protein
MAHVSKAVRRFRARGKRGSIMKPSTFKGIVRSARRRGLSKAAATREAGAAYWAAAKAKAKRHSYRDLKKR